MAAINPKEVCIGDIHGKGLMIGVELVDDLETKTPAAAGAGKVRAAMREKGVLIGVGGGLANVRRIQPPLSISKEELNQMIDTLKDILEC